MSIADNVRHLRRLRHATILTSICGYGSTIAWTWLSPGSIGPTALLALGTVAAALLTPTFFLAVTRAADELRGATKPSFGAVEVWLSCLLPVWSFFATPLLIARVGKLVASATDTPKLAPRMVGLAVLHAALGLSPTIGILFLGISLASLLHSVGSVLLFAWLSLLLIAPLEDAVTDHRVLALGSTGNAAPVAIGTLGSAAASSSSPSSSRSGR